ncbi:MAG: shikimate kinase [Thermodesulfobacteriota bacterium]
MSKYNKIYLLGFMGSGKSKAGALLAEKLDYHFIDLDLYIENKYKKSINQVFNESGEKYFRVIESESLAEVSNLFNNYVVSTGGGVILSESNRELMKNSGTTIYLKADLETIWGRIKSDKSRPLLNVKDPKGEAGKLLTGRTQLYEKSDFTLKTDNFTAEQVAEEVVKILKSSV